MAFDPGQAKCQLSRGQRRGRLIGGAHSEAYAQHISLFCDMQQKRYKAAGSHVIKTHSNNLEIE